MIIYNVTIKVTPAIAADWLLWMKEQHIPEVLNTKCFIRYQLVKLLETDETDGITYAAQYYAEDMEAYQTYISKYAAELRQAGIERWGDQFIAFRTLMEVVN
jgi:Domain of unknown function (DUF4286)